MTTGPGNTGLYFYLQEFSDTPQPHDRLVPVLLAFCITWNNQPFRGQTYADVFSLA